MSRLRPRLFVTVVACCVALVARAETPAESAPAAEAPADATTSTAPSEASPTPTVNAPADAPNTAPTEDPAPVATSTEPGKDQQFQDVTDTPPTPPVEPVPVEPVPVEPVPVEPPLPDIVDTADAAHEPPAETVRRIPLTLVISSDLDGALAEPDCRSGTGSPRRTLAHLAASSQLAVESALAENRSVAGTIHLGDFTGPAALGRWLLGLPGGPDRFAGFVARAGFDYLGLGNHWFDQDPAHVGRLLQRLPALGVQVLSANVGCRDRTDCAAIERLPSSLRLPVADLDVRLVGLALDSILLAIDPRLRKGLQVEPPAKALTELAAKLRADGADLVVATTHIATSAGGISPLSSLLAEARDVDLVVANHLGELAAAAATLQPERGTALAVAGDQRTSVLRLDFDAVVTTGPKGRRVSLGRLRAQRFEAETPDPSLADELQSLVRDFCAAWDRPLAAAPAGPLTEDTLRQHALDAMRRAAATDVAIVNDGLFDDETFPVPGPLSTADVYRAVSWDDEVVRTEVTGGRLRELWNRRRAGDRTRRRLSFAGVSERDGKVWVNGRPLDDVSKYRVALNRFVAEGGDDLVGKPLEYEVVDVDGTPARLRGTLLAEFSAPAAPPPLDLATRARWTWSAGLTLAANDTRVGNDVANPDPRLQRSVATAFRGEGTGRADVDATDHAGRITGRLRYAGATVAGAALSETEDQAFTEALYRLRALRRLFADAPWAPIPFVSGFLDAELLPAETAAFRHFELAGTVGVRLAPVAPFEIKAGASARREVFQPDGRMKFGLELGYELPRFSPMKLNGLPVDLESNLDFFVSDLGGDNVQEGRLRARLMLPLGGPLAATAGVDLLLLKRADEPYAFLSDFTFGITARFDGARQTF